MHCNSRLPSTVSKKRPQFIQLLFFACFLITILIVSEARAGISSNRGLDFHGVLTTDMFSKSSYVQLGVYDSDAENHERGTQIDLDSVQGMAIVVEVGSDAVSE